MIKILNSKIKGFSGITHILLALTFFFIMMLIPIDIMKEFVRLSKGDIKYFLSFMIVISGAALLPDLDNDESTAGYQLGIIGAIIRVFMKTTAYIVFSLYNLKNDKKPVSMHRLLWHAPIIPILSIVYFTVFMPVSNLSYKSLLTSAFYNKTMIDFVINNTSTTIVVIAAYISCKLGSNVLLYWPMKILPIGYRTRSLINTIIPMLVMIFIVTIPITQLKYIGIAVALGYLFHILGDMVSQGSVPIHWPIPWSGRAWNKPAILGPFQIATGGIVNTLLNFVLLGFNIILLIKIF